MKLRNNISWFCAGQLILTVAFTSLAAVDIDDIAVCNSPVDDGVDELVLRPSDLKMGKVRITGTAESDDAMLDKVEVSLDNGQTWQKAEGTVVWNFDFRPEEDKVYEVLIRATDKNGATNNVSPLDAIKVSYGRVRINQLIREKMAELVRSYVTEDLHAFMAHFSEDGYRDRRGDYPDLEDRVQNDFDLFTNMRIELRIESILKERGRITVRVYWNFTSDQHQGIGPLTGRDVFYFDRGAGMKIFEIRPMNAQTALFGFSNPNDPGQVLAPGAEAIPSGTATLNNGQAIDFETGNVTGGNNADVQFNFDQVGGLNNALIDDLGDIELASVATIEEPENQFEPVDEHVYAVKTRNGKYAIFQVTNFSQDGNRFIEISWEYQPDGSRSF